MAHLNENRESVGRLGRLTDVPELALRKGARNLAGRGSQLPGPRQQAGLAMAGLGTYSVLTSSSENPGLGEEMPLAFLLSCPCPARSGEPSLKRQSFLRFAGKEQNFLLQGFGTSRRALHLEEGLLALPPARVSTAACFVCWEMAISVSNGNLIFNSQNGIWVFAFYFLVKIPFLKAEG